MCGRMVVKNLKAMLGSVEVVREFILADRFNVGPMSPIAVIRQEGEKRVAELRQWGLVPSWSKDSSIGAKLFNARGETVAEKPSFRAAFKKHRCLVPASGFYEWQASVDGKGRKQPYYIHPIEAEGFFFAGLMEQWEWDGEVLLSACVITTEPNALMAPIHNRMPVILPEAAHDLWLSPGARQDALQALLVPYPAGLMSARPVGPAVGNIRNDGRELIA